MRCVDTSGAEETKGTTGTKGTARTRLHRSQIGELGTKGNVCSVRGTKGNKQTSITRRTTRYSRETSFHRPGPVFAKSLAMTGDPLRARTRQFALDVIDLCLSLGTDDLAKLIRPQLLRAGTSVAANNRAAGRCRSRKDFISKLGIVVEEADESELWLDILETKRHGPLDRVVSLRQEAIELRAIFVASRNTSIERARHQKKRKRV
jgi:four helix bundle protein